MPGYVFSKKSIKNLSQCHSDWIIICDNTIKRIDYSVICGHRGKKEQNEAFEKGNSKKKYPDSDHNTIPSLAFDFIPYPFKYPDDWRNTAKFKVVVDVLKDEAGKLGIILECGIDYSESWDAGHVALKSKNGIPYERVYAANEI